MRRCRSGRRTMPVTIGCRPVSPTARTAMRRRTWSRAATSRFYPPFNYPAKASLMRYTRGHQDISCQGCHESIHGLYPVGPAIDNTSYAQAAALNADGSHGPLKCGTCHAVDGNGIPTWIGSSVAGRSAARSTAVSTCRDLGAHLYGRSQCAQHDLPELPRCERCVRQQQRQHQQHAGAVDQGRQLTPRRSWSMP